MNEFLHLITPLFAFMLIPLWIPLAAIVVGSIGDRVRPRSEHPAVAESARRRAARPVAVPQFAS
ncbi:MAG: hypothetical protein JWR52_2465 [Marmoricola sp.]|nr:hypothetical protein [Marmoricola sp.]